MSTEHLFDSTGSGQDLRSSPFHEPRHFVIGTVPATDLYEPVSRSHVIAIRSGGHIAVEQGVSKQRITRPELPRQDVAETTHFSLDSSA